MKERDKIQRWVHLADLGGDPWVLPILGAMDKKTLEPSKDLKGLALYISTRLGILQRIITRLNSNIKKLYVDIKDCSSQYISEMGREGNAFIVDKNLQYDILADIDALLYEFDSACELMRTFFIEIYKLTGKAITSKQANKIIASDINSAGSKVDWLEDLNKHRNFFAHNGAPYIAIDLTKNAELLIMKENIFEFNDPHKYIKISELNEIIKGFVNARDVIQKHLIELLKQ